MTTRLCESCTHWVQHPFIKDVGRCKWFVKPTKAEDTCQNWKGKE